MGFYGNVSNITRSTFQFDKIYPNRKTMDELVDADDIYLGRYVLVEYDINTDFNIFTRMWYNGTKVTNTTKFYQTADAAEQQDDNLLIKGKANHYYFTADGAVDANYSQLEKVQIYKCLKDDSFAFGEDDNGIKTKGFIAITDIQFNSNDNYANNYNLDMATYSNSRGYDSTVWMKTYVGDEIKYVMIAELNTVVPTFAITPDAPSDINLLPHFDKNSTNVYYELHMPQPWTHRIAESKKYSDEKTVWQKSTLNINKIYDEHGKIINVPNIEIESKEVNAAIFYNKDGFNKSKRNYIKFNDEIKDEIKYDYASSGNLYNNDETGEPRIAKKDIKDWHIFLPSLGNTVSDMWDIVYGTDRNLNIGWNDQQGLRLVSPTENGDGYMYNYSKKENANNLNIDTLAGIINSTHDLMGMIITTEEEMSKDGHQVLITDDKEKITANEEAYKNGLSDANTSYIYYSNSEKEFYIKDLTYEYTEAGTDSNNEATYKEIALEPWENEKYYYKVSDKQYNLDVSKIATFGREYYTINKELVIVEKFKEDTYYKKVGNDYLLIKTLKDGNDQISKKNVYHLASAVQVTEPDKTEFYTPGKYYYRDGDKMIFAQGKDIISGKQYYIGTFNEDETFKGKEVSLIKFTEGTYYKDDGSKNYTLVTQDDVDIGTYGYTYALTLEKIEYKDLGGFYTEVNDWWTETGNKIYKMTDTVEKFKEGTKLYKITKDEVKNEFYIPGYYYYADTTTADGAYLIDYNDVLTYNKYYTYNGLYIMLDDNHHYHIGAPWIYLVEDMPKGVKLGTRQGIYQWKKLEGFADNYNTIHGLIVSINQMLKKGDMLTRDNQTVQGAINTLNDIINKFELIYPGKVLMVNDCGQVVSSDIQENRWINATIDSTVNKQVIEIFHDYRHKDAVRDVSKDSNSTIQQMYFADISGVKTNTNAGDYVADANFDATSTADKNSANGNGANAGVGDSLKLYTPIIDATGHVVGRNIETVTLPYGFKTIKTNGTSTITSVNSTTAVSTTNIVADNAQDELTINTGNKWLRITTDKDSDTITLSHEVHNTSTTTASADMTSSGGKTFLTTTYSFDEAGHYISSTINTITVPNNYGIFTDGTTTTTASGTQDTMTISDDGYSISAKVKADTIAITHNVAQTATACTSGASSVLYFGLSFTVPNVAYDKNGHIKSVNTFTVSIPKLETSGDNWISSTISNSNKVVVSHNGALTATATTTNTASVTKFGDDFKIPVISYDEKGHIASVNTFTVTIPSISSATNNATTTTNGEVLKTVSINSSTGLIDATRSTAVNLLMTGYSKGSETKPISTTDKIGTAIGKLENRLDVIQGDKNITGSIDLKINSATATMLADITTLKGTATITGSVANSIETAISGLSDKVLMTDNEDDGKEITIKLLLERIKALEAKIEELENNS